MTCYSDHNEDIRTKGSCDLCGSTEVEAAPGGEEAAAELEAELGPTVRAMLMELPGDVPEEIGPSYKYGWRRVDPIPGVEKGGAVLQVVESTNGKQWIATPARYYVYDVAQWDADRLSGLAIDWGMGWYLPREDFRPLIAFARRVMAEKDNPIG